MARLLSLEVPKTVIDGAGETPEKDPEQDSPLRTDLWKNDRGEADQKKDPEFFLPFKNDGLKIIAQRE